MKELLATKLWSLIGRVNIQVKIMGIVLLAVLTLGLALAWYISRNLASSMEQGLIARGLAIGNNVASHAADLILTENFYDLYRTLEGALQSDEDVRYIFIEDSRGQVLIHSFGSGFPVELLGVNRLEGGSPSIATLTTEKERLKDVALPMSTLGSVHVGLSTQRVSQAVSRQISYVVAVIIIVLVLGLFLSYLLARIIAKAVRRVVRVAEAVGRGDFGQRAPVWARDEIGILGNAFNEMTQRLQRSHRNLSMLYATANAGSQSLALEEVLKQILGQLCPPLNLLQARACLLGIKGSPISFEYRPGPTPWFMRHSLSLEETPCPCLEKLRGKPYVAERGMLPCPVQKEARVVSQNLCLPLRSQQELVGVLHLVRDDEAAFPPEEIELLQGVSEQLVISIENALLLEDLKEKEKTKGYLLQRVITAREEERRLIARELHDETSQALSSLSMGLKAIQESSSLSHALSRATALHDLATTALERVHNLAREIRLNVVDDLGLAAAVRQYLEKFARDTEIAVDIHIVPGADRPLPTEMATAIFRIIQEALTNVIKHARARHVSLVMERRDASLIVVVEDDGIGFNVAQALAEPDRERLGLYGMQERAALIGAKLSVESQPGAGCSVYLELPLSGREGEG